MKYVKWLLAAMILTLMMPLAVFASDDDEAESLPFPEVDFGKTYDQIYVGDSTTIQLTDEEPSAIFYFTPSKEDLVTFVVSDRSEGSGQMQMRVFCLYDDGTSPENCDSSTSDWHGSSFRAYMNYSPKHTYLVQIAPLTEHTGDVTVSVTVEEHQDQDYELQYGIKRANEALAKAREAEDGGYNELTLSYVREKAKELQAVLDSADRSRTALYAHASLLDRALGNLVRDDDDQVFRTHPVIDETIDWPRIYAGDSKKLSFSHNGDYVIYRFIPEHDGTYVYTVQTDKKTHIYTAPMYSLGENITSNMVVTNNCLITEQTQFKDEFKKGLRYYFIIKVQEEESLNRPFTIRLDDEEHAPYVDPEQFKPHQITINGERFSPYQEGLWFESLPYGLLYLEAEDADKIMPADDENDQIHLWAESDDPAYHTVVEVINMDDGSRIPVTETDSGWYFSMPARNVNIIARMESSIKNADVFFYDMDFTYTGKPQYPEIHVSVAGHTLYEGEDYTVTCKNNLNAGSAKLILTGMGDLYYGTKTVKFTIDKAYHPGLRLKGKTVKLKAKALKKAKKTVKLADTIKLTGAKGTPKYTVTPIGSKAKKALKYSNGKITVKKGTKKGTYKFRVVVKDNGNGNYTTEYTNVIAKIVVK